MDGGRAGDELLRLPVRARGVVLGRPVDLVLAAETLRVVGIDVHCGDDARRFLPFAAARVDEDEITADSALLLLDGGDLSFYRGRTRSLRELRGSVVRRRDRRVGVIEDVVVGDGGEVVELVLDDGSRVAFDGTVSVSADGTASAA